MAKAASMAALAVFVLSGCGTVSDTCRMSPYGETFRVYGGVRQDAQQAQECAGRAFGGRPDARCLDLLYAGWALLDMPLSAAADTLLLPVTVRHSRESSGTGRPERQAPGEMPMDAPAPAVPPQTP